MRPILAACAALSMLFAVACATKEKENPLFRVNFKAPPVTPMGDKHFKLNEAFDKEHGRYGDVRVDSYGPYPRYVDGNVSRNVQRYYQHDDGDGVDWWMEFEKALPANNGGDRTRWWQFVGDFRAYVRDPEELEEDHEELLEWDRILASHRALPSNLRGEYPLQPPFPLPRGRRLGTWWSGGWSESPNPDRNGQPMSIGLTYWDYLGTVTPVWAGGN